jgi:hypothetical protein
MKLPALSPNPSSKGFTFTISIILLSITLVSLVTYSEEMKNENARVFAPAVSSGGAAAASRVSYAAGELLRTSLSIEKESGNSTKSGLLARFPLAKEGYPLCDMRAFSAGLAYSMGGALVEPVVQSSAISGSSAVVANFSTGAYAYESNNGSMDIVSLYHMPGIFPHEIAIVANCSGNASDVGQFELANSTSSLSVRYSFNLTDGTGASHYRELLAPNSSNATLAAHFADGTLLYLDSRLSPAGQNYTSIHYTKSAQATLVLPFDENSSVSARDYSQYGLMATLGTGEAAPSWQDSDCPAGGCYNFGENDSISIASGNKILADFAPRYPGGPQRLSNGGFEILPAGFAANDSTPDNWTSWSITNRDANITFFAVNNSSHFNSSVRMVKIGGQQNDTRLSQTAYFLQPNALYTLSFYSRGDGYEESRYRVYDSTNGNYLRADGTWGALANLSTNVTSTQFALVERNFTTPFQYISLEVQLLPPENAGEAYFDTVLLSRSEGLNGGFEYFFLDNGSLGATLRPEAQSPFAQLAKEQYCWQKSCNTSTDCTEGNAPYCGSGCNPLSHTCYPDFAEPNFCRAVGQPCPDYPSLPCCGSSFCSAGACQARAACGGTCASASECMPSCPQCASPAGGGAATCRACVPINSSTACFSSSQCCNGSGFAGGLCNMGVSSQNFSRCLSCLPSYGRVCKNDSDCCSGGCMAGTCLPNSAPSKPSSPVISPLFASSATLIACIANCPPAPLPLDNESGGLRAEYKWRVNGAEATPYFHNRTDFRCSEEGGFCNEGDNVTLSSRVCDPHNSCTESDQSNPAQITSSSPPPCAGVGSECFAGSLCCQGLSCTYLLHSSPTGTCCIPSNPTWECAADSDCCSGKCLDDPLNPPRKYCAPLSTCGQGCASQSDCASECPQCASPAGGGAAACSACIPAGSASECASGLQCCPQSEGRQGLCDLLEGSANQSTCVSCLPGSHPCTQGIDCCSGKCIESSTGSLACAPASPSCAGQEAACAGDSDCCQPPTTPAQFCDLENRYPTGVEPLLPENSSGFPIGSLGSCRTCYSSYSICQWGNASRPCCDPSFSCQSPPGGGTNYYCLPNSSIPAMPAFYGFAYSDDLVPGVVNVSSDPTHVHGGSYAISLSGNSSQYVRSTALASALRGGKSYLLEFYSGSVGSTTGIRFAIFDSYNSAFLNSSGSWVHVQVPDGSDPITPDLVLNSSLASSSLSAYLLAFDTLPSANIELRFYPPDAGTAYLDDVSVTETKDFTFSAWVKSENSTEGASLFYSPPMNYSFLPGGILNATWSSPQARTGYANNSISVYYNLSNGQWHHISFSAKRTGNYSAYLDAALVQSGEFGLGKLNVTSLIMGFHPAIGPVFSALGFSGSLDEVRAYSRALSGGETASMLNSRLQLPCTVQITARHSGASLANLSPTASYNARLVLRDLPPSTILSLPLDTNATEGEPGGIADYSANSYCTSSGAQYTSSGKWGGAYLFNSTGALIECSSPVIYGQGDFSFSVWVKPNDSSGAEYVLGNLGEANPAGAKLAIESGYPRLYVGDSSISSTLLAPAGSYTHIFAGREQGQGYIYVNTLLGANGSLAGEVETASNFTVGNSPEGGSEGFIGVIDEARAFDRFLSEEDRAALYYDYLASYSGPLLARPG